jgi:hypothetical protein
MPALLMRQANDSVAKVGRLVIRLLAIALVAVVWPSRTISTARATTALSLMLAASCAWSALDRRDPIFGAGLNRWHETVVLLIVAIVIVWTF